MAATGDTVKGASSSGGAQAPKTSHAAGAGVTGTGTGVATAVDALPLEVPPQAGGPLPAVQLCHSAICGGTSPRPRPAWHDPEANSTGEEGEEGEEGEDEGDPEPSEGLLPLMGWVLFLSSCVALGCAWRILRRTARMQASYQAAVEELDYVHVEGDEYSSARF